MNGVIIRFVKNCKLSDRSKEEICCLYCFVALGDARNRISDVKSKYVSTSDWYATTIKSG